MFTPLCADLEGDRGILFCPILGAIISRPFSFSLNSFVWSSEDKFDIIIRFSLVWLRGTGSGSVLRGFYFILGGWASRAWKPVVVGSQNTFQTVWDFKLKITPNHQIYSQHILNLATQGWTSSLDCLFDEFQQVWFLTCIDRARECR